MCRGTATETSICRCMYWLLLIVGARVVSASLQADKLNDKVAKVVAATRHQTQRQAEGSAAIRSSLIRREVQAPAVSVSGVAGEAIVDDRPEDPSIDRDEEVVEEEPTAKPSAASAKPIEIALVPQQLPYHSNGLVAAPSFPSVRPMMVAPATQQAWPPSVVQQAPQASSRRVLAASADGSLRVVESWPSTAQIATGSVAAQAAGQPPQVLQRQRQVVPQMQVAQAGSSQQPQVLQVAVAQQPLAQRQVVQQVAVLPTQVQ